MLSKAAQREREAAQELHAASDKILRATSKFRSDSTAIGLAGQIVAASLIIDHVAEKIDSRTEED